MMTSLAMDIAKMVDMLPESEQLLAHEFLKRMVLAWDPDFTKCTPEEAARLAQAETEEFVAEADVDWEHLERY